MSHPSVDTLFLSARGGDLPAVAAHCAGCPDCAAKLRRLEGGAALLREAKRSVPDISWTALDGAMAREAERAAREMRLHPVAPSGGWSRGLTFGLAFAAAAAVAVVALRPRAESPAPVAQTPPPPTRATTPDRAPFEGAVLLATRGTTWSVDGASGPLAAAGALREGGRVEVAAGGRALVTAQPGCKLDLRGGTTATFERMRQGEAVLALAQGEVLSTRVGDADGAVAVRAGAWTVRADGAAITRRGVEVVRVVVLSGRAEVRRSDGAATQFFGPVTLELPAAGDPRVVSREAADAAAIDLSAFRPEGALFNVPPVDPAAVLSFGEGGATLPPGVEALRVAGPTTLSARVGRAVFTLEIGTGRVLAWTRVNAVAANSPAMNRPRPSPAPALTEPEPPDPGLSPTQIAAVQRAAAMRVRHCFSTCVERNQCAPDQGQLRIDVQPDGRASLGPLPASLEGARRCLENDMQGFRGSPSNAPYAVAIGFNTQR